DGIFRLGHEVRPNLLVLSLISLRLHGLFGLVILVLHLHCKSGLYFIVKGGSSLFNQLYANLVTDK
ncbi:hypothetical protein, partial [Loigolactobacillus zhaoyuanensis]|uniref:hypothetical protein n=1 Tax=Loigolactobacillus zhaoyuanensis TaxID=2486017 RepID=UPI00362812F9